MKWHTALAFLVVCCWVGVVAYPGQPVKRSPEKVVVEVVPVMVYEVPPIPSVLEFDFEEVRKGKSKEGKKKSKRDDREMKKAEEEKKTKKEHEEEKVEVKIKEEKKEKKGQGKEKVVEVRVKEEKAEKKAKA